MATNLNSNKDSNWATKKLWELHQKKELTHVDNYKEGFCYNCTSRNVVAATVVDICPECFDKRDPAPILTTVSKEAKIHGLCFFCGKYKSWIVQYNVRICMRCHGQVRQILKRWNKKGGMFGNDPFWLKMRKRHGKDWRALMFRRPTNRGLTK